MYDDAPARPVMMTVAVAVAVAVAASAPTMMVMAAILLSWQEPNFA